MSPKHITESVLADEFGVVTFYPHKQPTVYNVRKYSQHVNFAEAFSTHPVVTVAAVDHEARGAPPQAVRGRQAPGLGAEDGGGGSGGGEGCDSGSGGRDCRC